MHVNMWQRNPHTFVRELLRLCFDSVRARHQERSQSLQTRQVTLHLLSVAPQPEEDPTPSLATQNSMSLAQKQVSVQQTKIDQPTAPLSKNKPDVGTLMPRLRVKQVSTFLCIHCDFH